MLRTTCIVLFTCMLVATSCGGDDGGDAPSPLEAALASYLADPVNDTPAGTGEEGVCSAAAIIDGIGEDRLTEAGMTPDVIPEIEDWHNAIGMYVEIGDSIFSNALRRDGFVSERRLTEAKTMLTTYLSLYLPAWLPARERANNQ